MKIIFLIIDYMPHQLASIRAVVDNYGAAVTVFVQEGDDTPVDDKWISIPVKKQTRENLLLTILQIDPQLLVVAGWAIKEYVWVAKQIRSKLKIPTVSYSDSQWRSTFRQKINCLISPWHIQKAFSHLWVAGLYQFEYARKLGYGKQNIIFGSLSCDYDRFRKLAKQPSAGAYPKTMLFIGRFIESKGIDMLIKAWNQLENKKGWQLVLIGDGPQKSLLPRSADVIFKNYMPQDQLTHELQNAGCFIIPATWEQWAVVIHEAAASGLPIIATNACGATPHFVISGYNGYQVDPETDSIRLAIERIIQKSDDELLAFGQRSKKLSETITPEIGAANLMSVLNNYR